MNKTNPSPPIQEIYPSISSFLFSKALPFLTSKQSLKKQIINNIVTDFNKQNTKPLLQTLI